jgi:ribosomal-protein-alanine N-acetyltransferase
MPIFETGRLKIRTLTTSDLSDYQSMQGSVEVMRFTTGFALTPDDSANDLSEIMARYDTRGNETWVWAVSTKGGDFVGTCALFKNEVQEKEIAYRLVEQYWGQGFGQELADGLIDYCLDTLALTSIIAHAAKENLASVKILDRSRLTFVEEYGNQDKNWMERSYRYEAPSSRQPDG